MKKLISKLFQKPDNKLGAAPIYYVVLVMTIIGAALYLFVFKQDDSETSFPTNTEEQTSIIEKIKGVFSFGENTEETTETTPELRSLPTIPPEALQVQNTSDTEETVEENSDFSMEEINIEYVGRRDPMRPIVGEEVGTFNKNRINDKPSDLKDESKHYFSGMTVDDIVFDTVKIGKDDKPRGTFIVNGSIINDLEEGDYLAEIYYIKELNSKENYAIIQYKDKTYKLKAQNILNGNYYFSNSSKDEIEVPNKK